MKEFSEFAVLAAEDEPVILNNIVKKIEKSALGITVCGKAHSGQEALDLLHASHFDILITDIEMPGMSGLELIRRAKEDFPDLHIIVLRGYSNFEYARTALRYGVEDYLLKPVEQKTLEGVLSSLCLQIEDERAVRNREILSLALNDSPDHDAPFMFSDSGFLLSLITLGTLPPKDADSAALVSERSYRALWQDAALAECFHPVSSVQHLWLIDEHSPQQKFLILHLKDSSLSAEYLSMIMKKHLAAHLNGMPFLVLSCSQPISYKELWTRARFLRSAVRSAACPFRQEALCIDAAPSESDASARQPDSAAVLKDMNLLFSLDTESAFLQYVRDLLPEVLDRPLSVLHQMVRVVFEAVSQCFQIDPQDCSGAAAAFFSRLISMKSADECRMCLETSLKELWKTASAHTGSTTLCAKIAQYLEINLREQISLTALAQRFGYTPSYLNRIFKKEYGVSPLQYLTDLRISRAKELLLRHPDISIKTVASSVGYEDSRYFSRIFKNETGMTPSAWTEREKSGFVGEPSC